jgi:hypothetical protein
MICRSYGAYCNLGHDNYKDFAPTEHHPDLPNVQTPRTRSRASVVALSTLTRNPHARLPGWAGQEPDGVAGAIDIEADDLAAVV